MDNLFTAALMLTGIFGFAFIIALASTMMEWVNSLPNRKPDPRIFYTYRGNKQ